MCSGPHTHSAPTSYRFSSHIYKGPDAFRAGSSHGENLGKPAHRQMRKPLLRIEHIAQDNPEALKHHEPPKTFGFSTCTITKSGVTHAQREFQQHYLNEGKEGG